MYAHSIDDDIIHIFSAACCYISLRTQHNITDNTVDHYYQDIIMIFGQ